MHGRRSYLPNSLGVVTNRTVRRKLPHASNVKNRLASPGRGISPKNADLILAIDIGLVVGQHQERVMLEQVFNERMEEFVIPPSERTAGDIVQYFGEFGALFVITAWTI